MFIIIIITHQKIFSTNQKNINPLDYECKIINKYTEEHTDLV